MKNKLLIFAWVFVGILGAGMAQEKNVRKAKNLLNRPDPVAAAALIDEAVQNPETSASFDAWLTRGRVYIAIAQNPLFARSFTNPSDVAKESLEKAMQLDPGKALMMRHDLDVLANVILDEGVTFYEEKDYAGALAKFETSFQVGQMNGSYDTLTAYYAGLSAFNAADMTAAIKHFKSLVDVQWKDPKAASFLAESYFLNGQQDEAMATMDEALTVFPDDKDTYVCAASIYLRSGNNEKSANVMNAALIKWGDEPTFQRFLGISYQNEGKEAEAEAAFMKALELKPDFLEVFIDLGSLYVSKGNRLNTEANEVPYEETEKYEDLMAQAKEAYYQAVPYLEKILEVDPNNLSAMQPLRDIYVKVGDMAKAKELKAKIDELTGEGTGAAE